MEVRQKEFNLNDSQVSKSIDPVELVYDTSATSQPERPEANSDAIVNNDESPSSSRDYECPGCLAKFYSPEELQKHIILNIDTLQPGALRCNLSYQHMFKSDPERDLSPTKPYQCRECSRSFKTKGELRSHTLIHTDDKPFKCSACVAKFKRKTELRRHELVHLNLFPYRCSECIKSYRTKGELKSHFIIHSNYRQFKCAECDLEFKRRAELNRHRTGHQPPSSSSVTCVECCSLSNPDDLKKHLMAVHGIRLFKCRYCTAEFIREDDFHQHSTTHATTSVECSVCKEKVINVSKVFEGTVVCPSCIKATTALPKITGSSSDPLFHGNCGVGEENFSNILTSNEDADGAFACKDCDKVFRSKAQLGSHRITHSPVKAFKCLECGAEYRRKAELHRHALIHLQISPFLCIHCQSRFRTKGELKSHLLVHSDAKPFECARCRSHYKRKTELKSHQAKCYSGVTGSKSYQVVSNILKFSNRLKTMNSSSSSILPAMVEPSQWYQPCISLNAVFSHSYRYGIV